MYYLIKESLIPCNADEILRDEAQYAAVLTVDEWRKQRESFDIAIDMEIGALQETKAVVNLDSLTGTFSIPDRDSISSTPHRFAFALNKKGIVLIDDTNYVSEMMQTISRTKKWKLPSLERFLYDLLEMTISQDLTLLEKSEHRLNLIEEGILHGSIKAYPEEMNDIRGDLLDLRVHYEQLIDLGQELEENENDFFTEDNLRYFHLFLNRMARLYDVAGSLRDYTVQLNDLYKSRIDMRQNRIMTVLTVVTAIFMPLTLIVGWYGMNFVYMPELQSPFGYPAVMIVSLLIVLFCLIFFKRKKWL